MLLESLKTVLQKKGGSSSSSLLFMTYAFKLPLSLITRIHESTAFQGLLSGCNRIIFRCLLYIYGTGYGLPDFRPHVLFNMFYFVEIQIVIPVVSSFLCLLMSIKILKMVKRVCNFLLFHIMISVTINSCTAQINRLRARLPMLLHLFALLISELCIHTL